MKYLNLIAFLIAHVCCFSQSNNFFELDSSSTQHWTNTLETKNYEPSYIVYVNYDDCVNCNIALNLFNAKNQNQENTFYYFEGVPEFKIANLISELGLPDSVKIINDLKIKNFIKNKFKAVGARSTVIFFNYSPFVTFQDLKSLADHTKLDAFLSNGIKPDTTIQLNDNKYFYSSINSFVPFNNGYLAITKPKGSLLLFDSNYVAIKKFEIDTQFLKDAIYPIFISKYPDSIKILNPLEIILENYYEDVVPLGLDLFTFNDIEIKDDKIFLSIYVSLPLSKSKTKVSFEGQGYILELDNKLSIIKCSPYSFDAVMGKYLPLSMYGFAVDTKAPNTFNMALTNEQIRYNDKVYKYTDTIKIIGRWKIVNNEYQFDDKYKTPFIIDKEIKTYLNKHQDLAIKHSYINDTLIYFRYMPKLFNLKNNRLITLVPNDKVNFNKDGFPLYNCIYAFINPQTKNISCIEMIRNKIYLSNFDNKFNRVAMFPLPFKLDMEIIPFEKNGSLYVQYIDSKLGAFVSTFNLSLLK